MLPQQIAWKKKHAAPKEGKQRTQCGAGQQRCNEQYNSSSLAKSLLTFSIVVLRMLFDFRKYIYHISYIRSGILNV